jgi:ribosome-associated protein
MGRKTTYEKITEESYQEMEEFKIVRNGFVELKDLMKLTGMCESGGMAKIMILEGKVMVDGKIELRRRCKIRAGQIVTAENREVRVVV